MPDRTVEQLLDEGIELPDDPAEIAKLLADEDTSPQEPDEPKGDEGKKPDEKEPDEGDEPEGKEPEKDEKAGEQEPSKSETQPDEPKGPPAAVLRQTRRQLHQTREERDRLQAEREAEAAKNAELSQRIEALEKRLETNQGKLQTAADKVTEDAGVSLSEDSEAEIREKLAEYDDDIVGVVLDLHKQNRALAENLQKVQADREQVEKQQRQQTVDEAMEQHAPLLTLIGDMADGGDKAADQNWQDAIAIDKSLRSHPLWRDKPIGERFSEVERQMRDILGEDRVKAILGEEKPSKDSPKASQESDSGKPSGVPSSLSDLPGTGRPAAQSESERAETMTSHEIAERLDRVLEQGGDVDAYLEKVLSSG